MIIYGSGKSGRIYRGTQPTAQAKPAPGCEMRKCRMCGQVKPIYDFVSSRSTRGGHTYRCLDCERVKRRDAAAKRRARKREGEE